MSKQAGLYAKFTVTKNDGETDPNAEYMVLRIDKPKNVADRAAVLAYADVIEERNPEFSEQLRVWVHQHKGQSFEPYDLPVGVGSPFAATLKFDHDADLGEWSSVILFDDNRFNRGSVVAGKEVYRGWNGPTAPNILIETRAAKYWQDMCDLLNRAVEVLGI